ncbi:hypothetical protein VFPFJ_06758 [Purpureocillium lilacinum]|uniref:Uncharacterized protein n=1 Tax=Purpureocillium lilacinum TaxID=33203 RepID=A0A179HFN2_PURLI|nr:hypothetical protein VFPFJ_06758 [Purpureocillium lilacinum]OAQ80302.1 hypothetical protein VFPBJ_05887 [Purpureocillium lilacinum]OAQ88293.1 hypothetical protein VFPFJ_06758 [Purpureocillium lilacinum]
MALASVASNVPSKGLPRRKILDRWLLCSSGRSLAVKPEEGRGEPAPTGITRIGGRSPRKTTHDRSVFLVMEVRGSSGPSTGFCGQQPNYP